jgi:hypothetical protein
LYIVSDQASQARQIVLEEADGNREEVLRALGRAARGA